MRHIKYTKEILENAVKKSFSIAEVIRSLDMVWSGGTHGHLTKKIKDFGLDTSHFTRRGCNKGKSSTNKKCWADVLIKSNREYRVDAKRLRLALIESGREYKCEKCLIGDMWQNANLCIQIDHINGDWTDNSADNLRFLCPNCHSQTITFGLQKTCYIPKKVKKCLHCNNEFEYKLAKRKYCSMKCIIACRKSNHPKIVWPDISVLNEKLHKSNFTRVAKEIGVSDTALRKHLKKYAIVA